MIKLVIEWGTTKFDAKAQNKTFEDESKVLEWINKNYEKIMSIDHFDTLGMKLNPFEIAAIVRHHYDAIVLQKFVQKRTEKELEEFLKL